MTINIIIINVFEKTIVRIEKKKSHPTYNDLRLYSRYLKGKGKGRERERERKFDNLTICLFNLPWIRLEVHSSSMTGTKITILQKFTFIIVVYIYSYTFILNCVWIGFFDFQYLFKRFNLRSLLNVCTEPAFFISLSKVLMSLMNVHKKIYYKFLFYGLGTVITNCQI